MSLLGACALLAAALFPVAAAVALFSYSRSGLLGVAAAAIAAFVCGLSGSLALVAVFVGQRLNGPIQGIVAGMIFRMGLPLVAGMALAENSPPLAEAGIFPMILGLYLVALVIETLLSLRFVSRNHVGVVKAAESIDVASGIQSR